MSQHGYHVVVAYDSEAGVYYIDRTDVPGLNAETETAEEMFRILPALVRDMLISNGVLDEQAADGRAPDIPYSLMFNRLHASKAASV